MSHQYSINSGQRTVLNLMGEREIPPLEGLVYDTHAPYDAMAVFPTLFLNRLSRAKKKLPVLAEVSYIPGESLTFLGVFQKAAKRVRVGDHHEGTLPTSRPLGAISFHVTSAETYLSFLGADDNPDYVDIPGMTEDLAMCAAQGLSLAAAVKMIDIKNGLAQASSGSSGVPF